MGSTWQVRTGPPVQAYTGRRPMESRASRLTRGRSTRVKQSIRGLLRSSLGVEIHRAKRAHDVIAQLDRLPPPAAETVARAEGYYSASFPISPDCPYPEEEIERRIRSYYWHYTFQFGDRMVEADWPPGKGLRSRHWQRYRHVFPALLSLTGDSLEGKTVLDIGCNCGFWSIQAQLAGAQRVLGLEASEENVEQARLILGLTGLKGLSFEIANAYDVSSERHGQFDVVLYLGLLYHLENPVLALNRLADVTREVAVVDTTVVPEPASVCQVQPDVVHNQNYWNRLRMIPSSAAVALMLRHVGFREVLLVPRTSGDLPPDYERGTRETFLAVR
jgi:tRNA (mo5U34)-methyltransferase